MEIVNCCICNQTLMDEDIRTGFPCDHVAHTRCVFRTTINQGLRVHCGECNTQLINDDDLHEMMPQYNGDTRAIGVARDLYTTNTDFRREAKEYKRIHRECMKWMHTARQEIRPTLSKYREEIEGYLLIIRHLKKTYLKDILHFSSVRTAVRHRNSALKHLSAICNKWGISGMNICSILNIERPYTDIRSIIRVRLRAIRTWGL